MVAWRLGCQNLRLHRAQAGAQQPKKERYEERNKKEITKDRKIKKDTNEQASKHTHKPNNQPNEQASKEPTKQTYKLTNKQASTYTHTHARAQTSKYANNQTNEQTSNHTHTHNGEDKPQVKSFSGRRLRDWSFVYLESYFKLETSNVLLFGSWSSVLPAGTRAECRDLSNSVPS